MSSCAVCRGLDCEDAHPEENESEPDSDCKDWDFYLAVKLRSMKNCYDQFSSLKFDLKDFLRHCPLIQMTWWSHYCTYQEFANRSRDEILKLRTLEFEPYLKLIKIRNNFMQMFGNFLAFHWITRKVKVWWLRNTDAPHIMWCFRSFWWGCWALNSNQKPRYGISKSRILAIPGSDGKIAVAPPPKGFRLESFFWCY